MSNWNSLPLPNYGGHSRSASVAGYQNILYSDHEPPKYDYNWLNRAKTQYYTSSVDISKTKPDSVDYKKFSWASPVHNRNSSSVSSYQDSMDYSQKQRPFETAFKSAITKMKESGLSRLGAVDKMTPYVKIEKATINRDNNEFYNRNCQTLQPSRKHFTDLFKNDSKKIFRCETLINKDQPKVLTVSKISKDSFSDTELDSKMNNGLYKATVKSDDESNMTKLCSSTSQFKYSSHNKEPISGTSIIIPMKDNKIHLKAKDSNSVKTEAYLSPSYTNVNQSSIPDSCSSFSNINLQQNGDDTLNFEPLPSVQEIISKVEALNNQADLNMMSKSLNITRDKPPVLIQRSGSQRMIDSISSSTSSNEMQISTQKRMSGLYKKNVSNSTKQKTISNMPSDFQKLHLAFLDQKQENQRLRQELIEKNALINQLEADLRNYEPWR